ncbi:hypothetical protein AB0878_46425 [Amycolatopsis sp. NPDC047767]|uniref:hypothetical protein n=1 Tax=Amycolatopsis sp. NPDC047767 TaxID=3156765 RepID=UPI0034553297
MNQIAYQFHSPLTLLQEWDGRTDGAPLRECLVTGYTLDLVFFERHCVPTARALGARVTVLGDAANAVHEAVDVRQAGRAYQHAQASCGGAFHPKVVILAGDDDVWAAIGSGNPTMSGWGHNHELWLVLRASRHQGPAAMRDLGAWLTELPQVVKVPSWIADTLTHVGHWITPDELDGSQTDLRIFGNLRRSLVRQLPAGPVRSLRMTAPFFDAQGRGIQALINRLQPREVDLALQERDSQYSGEALVAATASVGLTRFRYLDEGRTRHGKLVEWTIDDTTIAMTGSANLSAAALLATTADGGNCELVTTMPVPASLLPEGTAVDRATIVRNNTIPVDSRAQQHTLVVLGARRIQHTILVELVTTTSVPITIESSPDGTPGTWTPVHVFTATSTATQVLSFAAPEALGGAVRARAEQPGERLVSPVVFLTDTARCRPRDDTTNQPRMTLIAEDDNVLTDEVLARRFNADLLRLLSHVQERKVTTGTSALRSATGATAAAVPPDDRWGVWLESVERSLGPHLTGLLFPGVLAAPGLATTGWSVDTDVDDTELADGESDDAVEELTEAASAGSARLAPDIPASQRAQYRTWARRWTRAATATPRPPLELRMLVTRTYLVLLAAAVWGTDEAWRSDLSDLTRTLVPDAAEQEDVPGQALDFVSSLIAVCLALLLQDAALHGGGEHDIVAKAAWTDAAELAAYADPKLAEEYLHVPDKPYARVPAWGEVETVIDLAVTAADDPHAVDRATLENEGLPARMMDGVWVIDGEFRNPRRMAARVATLVTSPSAVVARNASKTTIVLRDGRTLAIAESTAPRWRVYTLSPMSTPVSLLTGDEGLPSGAKIYPLSPIPAAVSALAEKSRINEQLLQAALHT